METPISPKVIVAAIVGIVLTAVVSNLSAITPDMLDFLGPWKLFVFGTLLTALTSLAAWWKSDPLRITPAPGNSATDTAAVESAKQTSLAATAVNDPAPAAVFPAAKVDAVLSDTTQPATPAPVEPVTVTPVFTPPSA